MSVTARGEFFDPDNDLDPEVYGVLQVILSGGGMNAVLY